MLVLNREYRSRCNARTCNSSRASGIGAR